MMIIEEMKGWLVVFHMKTETFGRIRKVSHLKKDRILLNTAFLVPVKGR
jgi:hypothetical protein